jgi:pimeloyl-ACP methyl ester carboxylesterase
LAASGIRGQYVKRNKLLRIAAKAGKLFISPLPKGAKTRLRKRAYAALGSDMFVAEHLQETFKKVVSEDLLTQAKEITVPTLLIYGANDTATPPKFAELYQGAIAHSKKIIIEDAGHFVHHDQPSKVLDAVRNFL